MVAKRPVKWALPDGVSVEKIAPSTRPLVNLRVGYSEAVITPSEARALARALIEAAGGSDGL